MQGSSESKKGFINSNDGTIEGWMAGAWVVGTMGRKMSCEWLAKLPRVETDK